MVGINQTINRNINFLKKTVFRFRILFVSGFNEILGYGSQKVLGSQKKEILFIQRKGVFIT